MLQMRISSELKKACAARVGFRAGRLSALRCRASRTGKALYACALRINMPKTMTATQVIEQGEYLQPDFDPASLTIPQLLGVFSFHEVKFPSRYTKEKLVQTFNDTLKPRVPQLLQDRLSRQHSPASDHGITDGRTGRPIRKASSVRQCDHPWFSRI